MRSLRLARGAAEAEILRLRLLARGLVRRGLIGGIALVFAMGGLGLLHFAAWLALLPRIGPVRAALLLAGCDLLVAAALGWRARTPPPDRLAEQALALRQQAVSELTRSLAMAGLMRGLFALLRRMVARGGDGARRG